MDLPELEKLRPLSPWHNKFTKMIIRAWFYSSTPVTKEELMLSGKQLKVLPEVELYLSNSQFK